MYCRMLEFCRQEEAGSTAGAGCGLSGANPTGANPTGGSLNASTGRLVQGAPAGVLPCLAQLTGALPPLCLPRVQLRLPTAHLDFASLQVGRHVPAAWVASNLQGGRRSETFRAGCGGAPSSHNRHESKAHARWRVSGCSAHPPQASPPASCLLCQSSASRGHQSRSVRGW